MIVNEQFLKKLRSIFDLNIYEVKIWTALLSRGVASAGELADISNVPRSRSYDVLESLEKKGFIIMKLGKPIKYIAVEPDEVVERVKKTIEKQANENINLVENIKSTNLLNELNTLYSDGIDKIDPMEFSGSFRTRENIYSHMESMIKNGTKLIVMNISETGLKRKLRSFSRLLEKASKKGVKIKVGVRGKINFNVPKHMEVRKSNINARFCIVDGKEILFMLSDDKEVNANNDAGVWVNTEFFTSAIQNFFENEWKGMEKVQ